MLHFHYSSYLETEKSQNTKSGQYEDEEAIEIPNQKIYVKSFQNGCVHCHLGRAQINFNI